MSDTERLLREYRQAKVAWEARKRDLEKGRANGPFCTYFSDNYVWGAFEPGGAQQQETIPAQHPTVQTEHSIGEMVVEAQLSAPLSSSPSLPKDDQHHPRHVAIPPETALGHEAPAEAMGALVPLPVSAEQGSKALEESESADSSEASKGRADILPAEPASAGLGLEQAHADSSPASGQASAGPDFDHCSNTVHQPGVSEPACDTEHAQETGPAGASASPVTSPAPTATEDAAPSCQVVDPRESAQLGEEKGIQPGRRWWGWLRRPSA